MDEKLRRLYQNQSVLIKGSFFAFAGGMVGNFLTYLFQLVAGRFLSPSDYGTLISLRSLMVYAGLLSSALQTALTKKVSELSGEKRWEDIAFLFWSGFRYLAFTALVVFAVLCLLALPLAKFLQVLDLKLIIFSAAAAAGGYLLIGPASFLSGLWRFKALSLIIAVNSGLLLITALAAISFGWGLGGIMGAHVIAPLATVVLAVVLLQKNVRRSDFKLGKNNFVAEIAKFTGPTLLISVSLMAFYNSDILLVKHFFSAEQAGIYSSASVVGRIIFFGTSMVTGVMFPVVSGKKAAGEDYRAIFFGALSLVCLGAIGLGAIYFLFPTQVVRVLFGQTYFDAIPLLPYFAVFMGVYSVLNLFSNFFLAVKNFFIAPVLLAGALAQAGAIWFWHESLVQVISVSALIAGVLVVFSFGLFYFTPSFLLKANNNPNRKPPPCHIPKLKSFWTIYKFRRNMITVTAILCLIYTLSVKLSS